MLGNSGHHGLLEGEVAVVRIRMDPASIELGEPERSFVQGSGEDLVRSFVPGSGTETAPKTEVHRYWGEAKGSV